MQTVRLPLLRGALFIIALAAISILLARADNPAQATTYEPSFAVSVSSPNPDASADIKIDFSIDAPDSFPNVKTQSSIQFIPRQWGVHVPETDEEKLARIGGIAGTFNALSTLGIVGGACINPIPVPFTMFDANTDTSNLASALDLGGDVHPSGPGYTGQFVDDPATKQVPGDLARPLIPFNADEKHGPQTYGVDGGITPYRDVDASNTVTPGDIRLADKLLHPYDVVPLPAGTVQAGDGDVGHALQPYLANEMHSENVGVNGQMDIGEDIYRDVDNSGDVSYGDIRLLPFAQLPPNSTVADFALPGGVSRYPDFLNQMFPPAVVGEPLARQWGGRQVITSAVSLNIVTFRPGQLPGYPATLGYPNVVIVLNPVAPIDPMMINLTNDLCAPLSLSSTNLGISRDNPFTVQDEGGFVRLTNPKAEKSHEFTLVTTSQPDADDDGIENMLDSCALIPNIQDLDGRNMGQGYSGTGDPDGDGLDGACDPDPLTHPYAWDYITDEDFDHLFNRADNCPTSPNGIELLGGGWVSTGAFSLWSGGFTIFVPVFGDIIGPDNQADADSDDIGDACEGAESGTQTQCAGNADDDGDGYVNDGCPINEFGAETGDQCLNGVDDDGDGAINDGCPINELGAAETGDQCLNAVDDDADGRANDGCPAVGFRPEFETATRIRLFLQPDSVVASSDGYGSPEQAFDGLDYTDWCTTFEDKAPGNYIEAQFASPQTINSLHLLNQWNAERFVTGRITMSNGFSQDITLNWRGAGSFTFPAQTGVTWVRFTGLTQSGSDACFTEFNLNYTGTTTVRAQCSNATDDDGDGVVNDGCTQFPERAAEQITTGCSWGNAVDDDGDGLVNDGCPTQNHPGAPETGAQCDNADDDDGDGLVNDGCPSVDPGDVAKTTITGHLHVVTLKQGVTIGKHGIKLDDLDGKEKVASGGSANYKVSLENKDSDDTQDAPVALRVVEGCGVVNGAAGSNSTTLSIPGNSVSTAAFDIDWSGCPDGEYTVQADACHAGDPAPAGLFGAGGCPGTDPHVAPPPSAQLSFSGATASSEAFGPGYGAAKAIDGLTETLWCTAFEPGVNIQASFSSPVSVDRVDIENSFHDWGFDFVSGTLTFSNGYSQDVTPTNGAGSFSVPLQSGVEWVKFTATAGGWAGCISELKAFGFTPVGGDTNPLDDAPRSITVTVGTP